MSKKYDPLREPFDDDFVREVRKHLAKNKDKWTKVYKRIDGRELVKARYRFAMQLPHLEGRKILIEKIARMDFLFGLFHHEKGVLMKKGKEGNFFDARYFDNRKPAKDRCVKTGHQTLGQGQTYALQKSKDFGYCELAEIQEDISTDPPTETILRKWGYLNGEEVDINVNIEERKAMEIEAAHRRLSQTKPRPFNPEAKEIDMNTTEQLAAATSGKVVTKVSPAAAKNAGKSAEKSASKARKAVTTGKKAVTAKKPKDGAKAKAKREPAETVGKPGSLLHSFGARAGTARAGLLELIAGSIGKMHPVKDVLKATYGSPNVEKIGALSMVIKGASEMIKLNKLDCHIARGEDAKGDLTIGPQEGQGCKGISLNLTRNEQGVSCEAGPFFCVKILASYSSPS